MKKQWVGWSLALVLLLSGCQHNSSASATSGNSSASDSKLVRTSSITLDQTSLSLVIGDKVTLMATILPANASDKVISWSSLDETVATVDSGKVTAVGKGTCVLLGQRQSGGHLLCDRHRKSHQRPKSGPRPRLLPPTSTARPKSTI
jgi:hypothetical protein